MKAYIDERLEAMRSELAQLVAVHASSRDVLEPINAGVAELARDLRHHAQKVDEVEHSLKTIIAEAFANAASARAWDREQLDAIGSKVTQIEFDQREMAGSVVSTLEHLKSGRDWDRQLLEAVAVRVTEIFSQLSEQFQAVRAIDEAVAAKMLPALDVAASAWTWDREPIDAIAARLTEVEAAQRSFAGSVLSTLDHLKSGREWDRSQLDAIGSALTHGQDRLADIADKLERLTLQIATDRVAGGSAVAAVSFPGIFIVGHARSGTSILLDALNSSKAIFMFGEANFHETHPRTDFRQWYNSMHEGFGNLRGKGTYCPALLGDEASGWDYLQQMSKSFRRVGDKVAFRDETLGYNFQRFFDFQTRHFFDSFHVCIIRHPYMTLKSSFQMFDQTDHVIYVRSYIKTILQILELYQTMPNVPILIHEMIDESTFNLLSQWMDIDLSHGIKFYEKAYQVLPADDWQLPELSDDHHAMLRETWDGLLAIHDQSSLQLVPGGAVNAYHWRLRALCSELEKPIQPRGSQKKSTKSRSSRSS
ncbi:MAG: sulfotransferase [Beijerinckiaceae bacterium]|nr:sulfotransferase [Beijerinckiaceae bacterium]